MKKTNLSASGSAARQATSLLHLRLESVGPFSSVRIPVTPEHREYLRLIRQAELEAWRSAPGGTSVKKPLAPASQRHLAPWTGNSNPPAR